MGYLCSNPECKRITIGPSSDEERSINIGVAAHITAASKNGPRYDPLLSSTERQHISNGIWLCYNCSVLIDKDEQKYTTRLIKKWKSESEKSVSKAIESRLIKKDRISRSILGTTSSLKEHGGRFYFLSKKNELVLKIEKLILNFNYFPIESDWDIKENYLDWKNPFYYSLLSIPNKLMSNDSENIINEYRSLIKKGGIELLYTELFNQEYTNKGIPPFHEFHQAVNKYFKKKIRIDQLQAVGPNIHVNFKDSEYIVSTYGGLRDELNFYCSTDSFDDISTMTDSRHWSEIYLDSGIEKSKFIPKLLNNWERYWEKTFTEIRNEIGSSIHLETRKERSWRQFQIFSEAYNDAGDIIQFSYDLDDLDLYPLVVLSMLQIFDKDICFLEYCELEFVYGNWESICVDDENDDKPIFYIKLYEE